LSSAIIVFAGGLNFYLSLKTLKETNIRNREDYLVLMQKTFENIVQQIDNSITLSQSYLLQYKNYYDQGKYTFLLYLHDELASLGRINYIQNVCIYYRNWGYTVSSAPGLANIKNDPDILFLESLDSMGFRYRNAIFRYKPIKNNEFIPVYTIIRSIPVYYHTEFPDAWAVIDIDLTSLNSIMDNIFRAADSYFTIINSDGTPLVSIGNNSLKEFINTGNFALMMKNSKSTINRIEYSGNLILYSTLNENEWDFIYIEPLSTISKDWFGGFLLSAIIAAITVLIAGIIGSFLLSRRIFNPIKTIYEKTNIKSTEKLRETDLILKKIDEIIEYNNNLEQEKINLEKTHIPYPVFLENEIFKAFRNGDKDKFPETLEKFRIYYNDKQIDLEIIQNSYLRLYSAIKLLIPDKFYGKDENPDYRMIFSINSADELYSWINKWFLHVFYILHSSKETHNNLLMDICRFIDSNLDKDITAKGLWQQFNFHPSSISKLFRDELQLTLKKYVDNKRIEKAKELLQTTNLKINEIAVLIGYGHPQSFIAFFHHIVHCTPAEYRRQNMEK